MPSGHTAARVAGGFNLRRLRPSPSLPTASGQKTMSAPLRNQSRLFSIDISVADAGLLASILKEQAIQTFADGRADVHQRLNDYAAQIIAWAVDGASLFCPVDFADLCIQLDRATHWQVRHRSRSWDRRGDVIVTLTYADGAEQSWTSQAWKLMPDAPDIAALRRSLAAIAPAGCTEAAGG
jgi:hypothetical protein